MYIKLYVVKNITNVQTETATPRAASATPAADVQLSLSRWTFNTFNFPAASVTGPGGERAEERRGEERSAAALSWFCFEGPVRVLAGVAELQSGAITPAVWEYHWLSGKGAVRKTNPAAPLALQKPRWEHHPLWALRRSDYILTEKVCLFRASF